MDEEINGQSNGEANDTNGHLSGELGPMNGGEIDQDVDEEEECGDDEGASEECVLSKSHRSKLCERICDILTAQHMALELLTNVCSAAGKMRLEKASCPYLAF